MRKFHTKEKEREKKKRDRKFKKGKKYKVCRFSTPAAKGNLSVWK